MSNKFWSEWAVVKESRLLQACIVFWLAMMTGQAVYIVLFEGWIRAALYVLFLVACLMAGRALGFLVLSRRR